MHLVWILSLVFGQISKKHGIKIKREVNQKNDNLFGQTLPDLKDFLCVAAPPFF